MTEDVQKTPDWLLILEKKRNQPHRLAHEVGAGSPCLSCGDKCPGLDLHFWRKLCRNCKCKKEEHDIKDDDACEQFEILFGSAGKKKFGGVIKLKARGDVKTAESDCAKDILFDWVPPNVPEDVASDYMHQLPSTKLPISGSDGALYRRQQMEKQVPLHDLDASRCHNLTVEEISGLEQYLENIKENVVGQGRVLKIPSAYIEERVPVTYQFQCVKSDSNNTSLPHATQTLPSKSVNTSGYAYKYSSDNLENNLFGHSHIIDNTVGINTNDSSHESKLSRKCCQFSETPNFIQHGTVPIDGQYSVLKTSSSVVYSEDISMKPHIFHSTNSNNSRDIPQFDLPSDSFAVSSKLPNSESSLGSSSVPNDTISSLLKDGIVTSSKITSDIAFPSSVPTDCLPKSAEVLQHPKLPLSYSEDEISGKLAQLSGLKGSEFYLTCQECNQSLKSGEVGVFADRAGENIVWHPQCFVCATCKELLVDLIYFYNNGLVYCGRHYAELLNIPRCSACDELIFMKEYTVAEGNTFHVRHFCCYECDIPLGGMQYIPVEGQPVCLECYQDKHGKRCNTCQELISPQDQRVSLKGIHWHVAGNCFTCFYCKKSLIGGKLTIKNNNPFCSSQCVTAAFT